MTIKQYKTSKLILTIILAITVAQAIVYQNLLIPVVTIVVAALILFYLKSKVTEIIADERDYKVAGKAAGLAIQLYSWLTVVIMLILFAKKNLNPSFETIAQVLAYSTCGLLLAYSVIFNYYAKK